MLEKATKKPMRLTGIGCLVKVSEVILAVAQ